MKHKFTVSGHYWFDAGLIGFYLIADELIETRMEVGVSGRKLWSDVKVTIERDGVVIEAPGDRIIPFFEACYEELTDRWWNRSTEKQIKDEELVCYDREKDEFKCLPKRMPTPIPDLFVGGSSWRVEGEPFNKLSSSLQERVTAFLEERKKSLWGSKKLLCYGRPVCHPQLQFFPKLKRGGGAVCSICGRTSVCDKVSQTSYLLFSGQSATFSFNSDLGTPDSICWECQMLGKFAVQSAFYKKVDDLTYILQLSGGDLPTLLNAHEIFGAGSDMRLRWDDTKKIYFSNFEENGTVLQYARLTYEILWGLYLKAYDLLLDNQRKRYEAAQRLEEFEDEDLDEESLGHVAALNVVLLALASKGNTFITKEVVAYSDAAYVFRLISYLKRCLKAESSEALKKDLSRFFEFLFLDLLLPNPQKPYDPLNGMDRNRILQLMFEKKSILRHVEKFVFEKSISEHPWLGRILFFVTCYEIAIHQRDTEKGEGTGMTEEQITIAKNLGAQIVISAREILRGDNGGPDSIKAVKGDLFTLRKTRTATDFLEQLNRLQFRYGIVVNKEIAEGLLANPDIPFEEFKAYCMISALNAYNNTMRLHDSKGGSGEQSA